MESKEICNICGQELDFWDKQEDFSIHKSELGYGTLYDGDKLHMRICCGCMNRLIKSCAVDPIEEGTHDS